MHSGGTHACAGPALPAPPQTPALGVLGAGGVGAAARLLSGGHPATPLSPCPQSSLRGTGVLPALKPSRGGSLGGRHRALAPRLRSTSGPPGPQAPAVSPAPPGPRPPMCPWSRRGDRAPAAPLGSPWPAPADDMSQTRQNWLGFMTSRPLDGGPPSGVPPRPRKLRFFWEGTSPEGSALPGPGGGGHPATRPHAAPEVWGKYRSSTRIENRCGNAGKVAAG